KTQIFDWGVEVGRQFSMARQAGRAPGMMLSIKHSLAGMLVYGKIRAALGGRLRFFISGSAPMSREVSTFFDGVGVRILEGYGLTESSAGTFVNTLLNERIGTVGRAMP